MTLCFGSFQTAGSNYVSSAKKCQNIFLDIRLTSPCVQRNGRTWKTLVGLQKLIVIPRNVGKKGGASKTI